MILHPIIDLLKRIVVALPDYAGGGGAVDDVFEITSGSFTLATPLVSGMYIQHGLSTKPFYVAVVPKDNIQLTGNSRLGGIAAASLTYHFVIGLYGNNGTMSHAPLLETNSQNTLYVSQLDTTTFMVAGNTGYPYPAGIEFEWRAYAFKE